MYNRCWNGPIAERLFLPVMTLLLLCSSASGQPALPAALDTLPVFTDLDKALETPEKVYHLDLSRKRMDTIPGEVYGFPNLKVLDLSRNKIDTVPPAIGRLKELQVLRLGRNDIRHFQPAICQLSKLWGLRMGENRLQSLPPCIGKLQELRILDLWSNDLRDFPAALQELSSLEWMDLRAILMSAETQKRLLEWLPDTELHLSSPCDHCDL